MIATKTITIQLPPNIRITQNGERNVIYVYRNDEQLLRFSLPGTWTFWVNWSDEATMLFIEVIQKEDFNDRQVMQNSLEVLNQAIDALQHGEPSLKNGRYDREGWQEVVEESMDQVDLLRQKLGT